MKTKFVCGCCGAVEPKWFGRCQSCGEYNTMQEVEARPGLPGGAGAVARADRPAKPAARRNPEPCATPISEISANDGTARRAPTGIGELDLVLGGGLVGGGMLLLGGDPGIGKSTLLLQLCKSMAGDGFRILYASGEESLPQIKMRAQRLGANPGGCYLVSETDVEKIAAAVAEVRPSLLLIDSIQTMRLAELGSLPGSATQVRECAAFFTALAKRDDMAVVLVGHVTKEGSLAGPRVLEHMVDTVLYFEGEGKDAYRVIRAVKNRFGSTHEIGIFEMGQAGLESIADPSAYMLAGRLHGVPGSSVICSMEGTRPLLTEVQGLVSYTNFGTPRRTANGVDYNRMVMLMAVLEKRAGYKLGTYDAYVNIAGGLRVDEPAADAGIVCALASCYKNMPLDGSIMVMGEVGLGGEMRAISHADRRMAEASRQGFSGCVMPSANKGKAKPPAGFRVLGASNVNEMLAALLGGARA